FFFNHPATPEIYTLSLHDALPICPSEAASERSRRREAYISRGVHVASLPEIAALAARVRHPLDKLTRSDDLVRFAVAAVAELEADRKSTRLNSSHSQISYAVFCLK